MGFYLGYKYILMVLIYRYIIILSRDAVVKVYLKLNQGDIGGNPPLRLVTHLYNVPSTIH